MSNQIQQATKLPIDAKDLANYILDVADAGGIAVTNLALQKILFFCHANFLVHFEQPLIRSKFEVWNFGPVVLSVYEVFRAFNRSPITARALHYDKLDRKYYVEAFSPSAEAEEFLKTIILAYGKLSPSALVNLSHQHNGPWDRAQQAYRQGANFGKTISNELIMASFYPPLHIGKLST